MSRSQSELSLTQCEILQLVIYRTKNHKSPTFFCNNEYIGKCVDVKELENIFFAQGVTKEQIDMMIKRMDGMQMVC